jgi:hypothetical protein
MQEELNLFGWGVAGVSMLPEVIGQKSHVTTIWLSTAQSERQTNLQANHTYPTSIGQINIVESDAALLMLGETLRMQ